MSADFHHDQCGSCGVQRLGVAEDISDRDTEFTLLLCLCRRQSLPRRCQTRRVGARRQDSEGEGASGQVCTATVCLLPPNRDGVVSGHRKSDHTGHYQGVLASVVAVDGGDLDGDRARSREDVRLRRVVYVITVDISADNCELLCHPSSGLSLQSRCDEARACHDRTGRDREEMWKARIDGD
eukprot:2337971-Rhodomonas_salina.1